VPVIRQAALADPAGFVDYPDMMVIDEIQRVPELLLPIKVEVDNDGRPGRYLLSGSARVLGLRALPDTLPGRMETIELWPFSQGESAFRLGPGTSAPGSAGHRRSHSSIRESPPTCSARTPGR
jgi:uncharacterized protein